MADRNASAGALFSGGLLSENPILRLGLGLCPALAVTTTAMKGLAMGVATGCVLVCTSLIVSILGKALTEKGRLPVSMLVSAVLATVVQLVLKGWYPELNAALGVYVPLIAVSCLILGRASFAAEAGPVRAVADSIGMGLGYICGMTVIGILRELISAGSVFGSVVLPASYDPMILFAMPAGGFLALGLLMGLFNLIVKKPEKKEDEAA